MMGLSIALGAVGCGPGITLEEGDSSEQSGESTEAPEMTTAVATSDGPMTTSTQTSSDVSTGSDTLDDSGDDPIDSGGSFYGGPSPDGGTVDFECDMFAQDCPEGEKCMPWANDGGPLWNATRCSPVANAPGDPGDPCTVEGSPSSGLDDCDVAAVCFNVDPMTNEGVCVPTCGGNEAMPLCEDPDTDCMIDLDGSLVLCMPTCDPVLQDCAMGEGCFPSWEDEFYCVRSNAPAATHGDTCEWNDQCGPGQVCISEGAFSACMGIGCCTTVCALDDLDADADCAALDPMQVCVPWYEEGAAPMGMENIGACSIPF